MVKDNGQIPEIPFMKAYNFLLNKTNLTSAEKLVLIVVCRFWPNPYWGSNAEISKTLGFTERYIEKIVKNLADKNIIKRGYAHVTINGRLHTVRVIVPRCFPKIPGHRINWVKPEHIDGEQSEHMDGDCPNNSSFLPEQSDDLLDKNIKEKKTPFPLPAGGQAPALLNDRKDEAMDHFEQLKGRFGKKRARKLTAAEFEQRRQEQKRALLSAEADEES